MTATTAAALADLTRDRPWRPSALGATSVFIGRSVRHAVRDVESMLMALVLPIMLMLMFTWVFGGAIEPGGGYVDYVVPGIILICAGFGSANVAVAINRDMTQGVIDRFRSMPVPAFGLVIGHVVASVAKNLLATAVVIGVALAVGFRPEASALQWLAVAGIITAWIVAITLLFAAIGLAAGSPDAASGYGFILLFLPYLSSGFAPVETMPEWLRPIAQHQPATPIIDSMRALLAGGDPGSSGVVGLLWCAGIAVVAALWGSILFRRARRG